jgi:signal recognition particle subunit SRP68
MEITKFIVSARAQSYGDFSTYHSQLSRRLLKCRRRLGIATRNRGKYNKKDDVTAEKIKEDNEYVLFDVLTLYDPADANA